MFYFQILCLCATIINSLLANTIFHIVQGQRGTATQVPNRKILSDTVSFSFKHLYLDHKIHFHSIDEMVIKLQLQPHMMATSIS